MKEIEIPEGYEARIEGNKVILEPKESEDEMIRKDIIGGLMWQRDNLKSEGPHDNNLILQGFCFTVGEHLAYLEKQKEQQPAEWSEEDETCLEDALWCVMKARHFVAKDACDLDACRCAERWLKFLPERFNLQPKQEWSEKDEKILNNCVIALKEGANGHAIVIDYGEHERWLKSLPERFNIQPKPEWSEEDETAYGDLMWCIEQAKKSAKDENDMGNIWFAENWIKNRIKSLRPQPHWKPSEEQMTALKKGAGYLAEYGKSDDDLVLDSLYDDLKKL